MSLKIDRRQFIQMSGVLASGSAVSQLGCAPLRRSPAGRAAPSDLMVSLLNEPLGIRPDYLRLSWVVPALEPETYQGAFQIQFSERREDLLQRHNLIWDSGKVLHVDSTAVPYSGESRLLPDRLYYWRVRIWSTLQTVSEWSDPQRLITSAPNEQWTSLPIWKPAALQPEVTNAVDVDYWMLARKEFVLDSSDIEGAWLRVTGQSPEPARQYVYRLWINDSLVGVGPVRSMADEVRYNTYDVGHLLKSGDNTVAALSYSVMDQLFMAELVIQHREGHRQVIATDGSWKTRNAGNWRPASGFTGGGYYKAPQEYIDARAEPVGWTESGFDDSDWHPAEIKPFDKMLEPAWVDNMVFEIISPVSIEPLAAGRWVLDFGKEIVGGIRLDIVASDGQTVELRLGEELNDDYSVRYQLRAFPNYREIWTLRDGRQQLEHWGYRAFRWAEIITDPTLDISNAVKARLLKMYWDSNHSAFVSSDTDLNKVWEMCRYSIEATRQDIYQDTPTRERGPYEGDAIINQMSEYVTQRSYGLARYSTSYLIRRSTWPTEYRLQTAILVWEDYLATGDDSNLASDYTLLLDLQLDEYLNASGLVEKDPGASSIPNGDLVDWPITNRDGYIFTRINTVINAWQFASFTALSGIASVLGHAADERRFAKFAQQLQQALNREMLAENGAYRDGWSTEHQSQHATAFPLALGITTEEDIPRVATRLVRDVETRGMQVSVYGAQFLLDALYRAGAGTTAHDLLVSRSQFSWLHMIEELQATIVMEAWDPAIKPNTTFSHAWGSAPANVVQRHIAGVQVLTPGAGRLRIAPQPGRLQWFEARVPTIRGTVQVNFTRAEEVLLEVVLPPNVKGQLHLDLGQMVDGKRVPLTAFRVLGEDNKPLRLRLENESLSAELGPGRSLVLNQVG